MSCPKQRVASIKGDFHRAELRGGGGGELEHGGRLGVDALAVIIVADQASAAEQLGDLPANNDRQRFCEQAHHLDRAGVRGQLGGARQR